MTEWQSRAACADRPDLSWFPEPVVGGGGRGAQRSAYLAAVAAAIKVCSRCPVQDECAEAGRNEPAGIWGGVLHTPSAPRLVAHGTEDGYRGHVLAGEEPCVACDWAHDISVAEATERRRARQRAAQARRTAEVAARIRALVGRAS